MTARYDAPDLISQRPKVSADIYDALTTKLAKYGARVINIDMTGFSFSPTYMAAINDKVTQEQLRLAAENKLKTVEAEQKQNAVAEAEANAVRATGTACLGGLRITNADGPKQEGHPGAEPGSGPERPDTGTAAHLGRADQGGEVGWQAARGGRMPVRPYRLERWRQIGLPASPWHFAASRLRGTSAPARA